MQGSFLDQWISDVSCQSWPLYHLLASLLGHEMPKVVSQVFLDYLRLLLTKPPECVQAKRLRPHSRPLVRSKALSLHNETGRSDVALFALDPVNSEGTF